MRNVAIKLSCLPLSTKMEAQLEPGFAFDKEVFPHQFCIVFVGESWVSLKLIIKLTDNKRVWCKPTLGVSQDKFYFELMIYKFY